jgi:hypothetical protein
MGNLVGSLRMLCEELQGIPHPPPLRRELFRLMMRMRSDYGLPFGTEHAHHQPLQHRRDRVDYAILRERAATL